MTDYIDQIYHKPKEWHERRRNGIGGSDANIIMSGNDDKIIRLWREKRGEIEPEDMSGEIPVLMGIITEQLNLALFERKTGLTVIERGTFYQSKEWPVSVTLDGLVDNANTIVEAKHVGGFEPFGDVIDRYYPQMMHGCMVTGASHAYLSVLIGNHTLAIEKFDFDPFYADQLLAAELEFWDCVKTGRPPRALPPTPPAPGKPYKIVDMSQNNQFVSASHDFILFQGEAKKFETAKDDLKSLVENDVIEAYNEFVSVKRDRRGYLRITVKEKK